jgi:hypothetical protein
MMNERAIRHIRSPCFEDIARLTPIDIVVFVQLGRELPVPGSDICCAGKTLQRLLLLCNMQWPRGYIQSVGIGNYLHCGYILRTLSVN